MIIPRIGDYVKFAKPHHLLLYDLMIEVGSVGRIAHIEYREHGSGWAEEVDCLLYIAVNMKLNPTSDEDCLRFIKFDLMTNRGKFIIIPESKAAELLYAK